jgi:hypothetical protein
MKVFLAIEGYNLIGIFEDSNVMKEKVTKYLFDFFNYGEKIKSKNKEEFEEDYKKELNTLFDDGGIEWNETTVNIVKLNNDMVKKDNKFYKIQMDTIYDFKEKVKKKEPKRIVTRSPISENNVTESKVSYISSDSLIVEEKNLEKKIKYSEIEDKTVEIKNIKIEEFTYDFTKIPKDKIFLKDLNIPNIVILK